MTYTWKVVVIVSSASTITVMTTSPRATPVTTPVALTVATSSLLDVNVTFCSAVAGATVAVNCRTLPMLTVLRGAVTDTDSGSS